MISQLLADGTGSLYHEACTKVLGDTIENATRALTRQPPAHRAEILSRPAKPTAHTVKAPRFSHP